MPTPKSRGISECVGANSFLNGVYLMVSFNLIPIILTAEPAELMQLGLGGICLKTEHFEGR